MKPNCSSPIVVSSLSLLSMILSQIFIVCDISFIVLSYCSYPSLCTLWFWLQMRLWLHPTSVNRWSVLPSELTNAVTNTIEQFNRVRSSEWSTFHLHLCMSYQCIWGWQHLQKPSSNVISPIFYCYFNFALALHPLVHGRMANPQPKSWLCRWRKFKIT